MALLDTRSRSGYLFLAVAVGHIILISAQVNARSGVPLLQAVVFGGFAEVQRATTGAVRAVRGVWEGYFALQDAHRQNEALKRENDYLRVKLQQTRELALESQALRAALALRDRSGLPMRAAEIIGTSATADFRTVTIDRGTADGIKADMPVVCASGAVGRVVFPSRHAAKVQLLVDRNAAVAVKVERPESGAQGIATGSGESLLRLEYLSTTADIKVGDVLVTSGIDGVYPPGFAVGRVETLERSGGTFRSIRVRPAVSFSDLEDVLVVLQSEGAASETSKPAASGFSRTSGPQPSDLASGFSRTSGASGVASDLGRTQQAAPASGTPSPSAPRGAGTPPASRRETPSAAPVRPPTKPSGEGRE